MLRPLNAAVTPPTQVVAMVQVLEEMKAVYTPILEKGRKESLRASEVAQRYGVEMTQLLQRYGADEHEYWRRCKRASLLYDWIEGTSASALEKQYSTTPVAGAMAYGNIVSIADTTRFHLRSAHQILSALFPEQPDFLSGLDQVLERLEFGLPAALLPLAKPPVRLVRGDCLALAGIGVYSLAHLNALSDVQLRACVSPRPLRGCARRPRGRPKIQCACAQTRGVAQ